MVSENKKENKNIERLVKDASVGDEQAFSELYSLYSEKIYRFIYFRVGNEETAEDLVAETFIKVWDGLEALNEAKSFNGWVYQIARNLIIDHYRSDKKTVDLEKLENVLEYEDGMIDQTNLEFDLKKILKHLPSLSQDQQIVIRLKFIEDLDNDEIAEILDKTEGAIRVIQHRAINQLKILLSGNNNED